MLVRNRSNNGKNCLICMKIDFNQHDKIKLSSNKRIICIPKYLSHSVVWMAMFLLEGDETHQLHLIMPLPLLT